MHKKIVSTCSPNNNMYWVCIQYIVKKYPDGLFLVTPYVGRGDNEAYPSNEQEDTPYPVHASYQMRYNQNDVFWCFNETLVYFYIQIKVWHVQMVQIICYKYKTLIMRRKYFHVKGTNVEKV